MNDGDIRDLALLHSACVKDSLVTELGVAYACCFYRYLDRSDKEFVWVRRDPDSRIVAASVFTLEPDTLSRRLLLRTPLLWYFFLGAFRVAPAVFRALRQAVAGGSAVPEPELPEWILLFTADSQRGNGLGASLIEEMEMQLKALGILKYKVRTNADPANKALAFHLKHGCKPLTITVDRGRRNQLFTKTLSS
jgi:GNAT superfamily N-acetyltransferase